MRLLRFLSYLLPVVAVSLAALLTVGTAGAEQSTACKADLTGDGVVNFRDLAVFRSVFLASCNDPGAFCGDGVAQGPGEQCDDGNLASGDGCSSTCEIEIPLACTLPATGQTGCWDTAGTEIPCAGTGQDGDIQAGATLAYLDNGDGTITDVNTGLMWEKIDDNDVDPLHDKDTLYTWDAAFAVKIATLNEGGGFAGYTDWRLPNRREMESLLNLQNVNQSVSTVFNTGCVATCTVTSCSCTKAGFYWSSSSLAPFRGAAWLVHFNQGIVDSFSKALSYHVRAVRGGL